MAKWFGVRNAPGSQDLNPQQEWKQFKNVLLELMGRPQTLNDRSTANQTTSEEPKKRKKNENCEGGDSDWEYLLAVTNPCYTNAVEDLPIVGLKNNSNAVLFPYIPLIFYTFHLFYEDMKIDPMMKLHLNSMAEVEFSHQ